MAALSCTSAKDYMVHHGQGLGQPIESYQMATYTDLIHSHPHCVADPAKRLVGIVGEAHLAEGRRVGARVTNWTDCHKFKKTVSGFWSAPPSLLPLTTLSIA